MATSLVRAMVGSLTATATVLALATPAVAHDHRAQRQHGPSAGAPAPEQASSVASRTALALPAAEDRVSAAAADRPSSTPIAAELTNLPEDPAISYSTPADPCAAPACAEFQVDVPKGAKTLYATMSWLQSTYYLHLWGIGPDGKVNGNTDVDNRFDKTIGNERTIPVSQFTVGNPQPGKWRIQARAVFGFKVAVRGAIAVSTKAPVVYQRTDARALADRFATQPMRVNVVFLGRTPKPEQLDLVKDQLPDNYRAGVLTKAVADGSFEDDEDGCAAGTLLNWNTCHYTGTRTTEDDEGGDAGGRTPFFEPLKWTYSYRFFSANEQYTRDLFGAVKKVTRANAPFDDSGTADYLTQYNTTRGAFRGADAVVRDATKSDKADAYAVEDWIFRTRGDKKYASAFTDLDSGRKRDGRFINPDPTAFYDPFYTAKGKKDLNRMPHGPSTSVTVFVLDTFSTKLAREYFRPDAYHSFDVSQHMRDPDVNREDAPDYMRFWGGRYRFFLLDIGAMPNEYERADGFTGSSPTDSTTFPLGDPPVWEALNNPVWDGETTVYEKIARNVRTSMFFRFTAPYLYRPLPADVFFLASNNWSDFYSRPEGGGLAHTRLEKIYRPDYVERNLASAMPGATFTTERSDPKLKTYRYLGCSDQRAGTDSKLLGTPKVLIPDPSCTKPDPAQRALEEAKSQGDDVVGVGANAAVVSAGVVRRFIEEHRNEFAPLRPGQFTLTNISVVFPGASTWTLPAIVGGIAFGTPNNEIWGILNNTNDRVKPASATDCSKSPVAPGCNGVPVPSRNSDAEASGFSYTVQHEASHFLGLLHPHDALIVNKSEDGTWDYYADQYVSMGDFSQAPTTYAGAFTPYSVLDQDIVQRGHVAEYMRQAMDTIAAAYQADGMAGLAGPSKVTLRKQTEMEKWRAQAGKLFACGDYLHAEHAQRNSFLAAQGVFGPVVEPRALKPGERVLFKVKPQAVYGPDGPLKGCATPTTGSKRAAASVSAQPAVKPVREQLPATGGTLPLALAAGAIAAGLWLRRRIAHP